MQELRQDETVPLSDSDIQLLIGPTNIVKYPDLKAARRIEDVLDSQLRVVVLFLTESQSSGHWQLVHRPDRKKKVLEFFCSYGSKPDEAFDWLSDAEEAELGQQRHELTRLLKDAQRRGWDVTYNPTCLQLKRGSIATCGRWVCCRALLHSWPLPKFAKTALQTGDPDLWVTALTEQLEDIKRAA